MHNSNYYEYDAFAVHKLLKKMYGVKTDQEEQKQAGTTMLSKNVPTPELSCRFAVTGRFVMRIPTRGVSSRVLDFV